MFGHGAFSALKKPSFLLSIISEGNYLWGSSSLAKYSKYCLDSGNPEKKLFQFGDHIILIVCVKHLLWLRENTRHWVSLCYQKISGFEIPLKQKFSTWFFSEWSKNVKKKYCHADLRRFSDTLTCSLSISYLTEGFLGF